MSPVLMAVLGTLGTLVVVAALVAGIIEWRLQRHSKSALAAALDSTRMAAQDLAGSIEKGLGKFEEQDKEVRALLDGLVRVSQEQVAQLVKFTAALEIIAKAFGHGPGGGYQEFDEREASREAEIQDAMRRGRISREDAEARVKEAEIYRNFRVG